MLSVFWWIVIAPHVSVEDALKGHTLGLVVDYPLQLSNVISRVIISGVFEASLLITALGIILSDVLAML